MTATPRQIKLARDAVALLSAAVTKLEAAGMHEARARAFTAFVRAQMELRWAEERHGEPTTDTR